MVPVNLILAAALIITANDLYQIADSFRDVNVTYHFLSKFLESAFSTLVMGGFVVYGLAKETQYRKMRLLFLTVLLLDLFFDFLDAYQSDGQTSTQVRAAIKQIAFPQFYIQYVLPAMVSCCICLLAAVSFMMGKPFFYVFPQVKIWQSTCMKILSGIFYFETTFILLVVTLLISTRH